MSESAAFVIAAIVSWSLGWPLWASITLTVIAVLALLAELDS